MCCRRLAGNTGCKNDAKNRHLRTIAQFCRAESLQLKHVSTIGEKMLSPHTSSPYGELPLAAEVGSGVWGTPANFNDFRVLPSLLQRLRSTEANQTLRYISPSPGLLHYIYNIFRGSCPLTEFCQVQNSLCVQVLRSSILASSLHGTRTVGVSQTLRCGTTNRITELSQRAAPIWLGGHHAGYRPTF